jgi:hypothetical protein
VDRKRRRCTTAIASALTVLLLVALAAIGAPLVGPESPFGIVSLQFVADHERAMAIVAGWGPQGRAVAVHHLALDLVLPFAYATALAGAANALGERSSASRPGTDAALRLVGRAAVGAAGSDLVENVAMLLTVTGRGGAASTAVTVTMAIAKSTLLVVALLTLALVTASGRRDGRLRQGRSG